MSNSVPFLIIIIIGLLIVVFLQYRKIKALERELVYWRHIDVIQEQKIK